MNKDFSKRKLQNASLRNQDLTQASFTDCDLRGADFSGSNLRAANFIHVKTGITPTNTVVIFLAALVVSLLSGYIAMIAGHTVQQMLGSTDSNVRAAGIATIVVDALLIGFYYRKGGRNALMHLVLPVIAMAVLIGIIAYVSGLGTGMGMLYLILSLVLLVAMFTVGTIARVTAGSLSNVLFLIVALSGAMFGKSVGGGIGTVVMAVSCALISKKALSGAKGFEFLQKIAILITSRFGTSFRNTSLRDARFSQSQIHNSDFSNTDVSLINWGNTIKKNCIINEKLITNDGAKKHRKHEQH